MDGQMFLYSNPLILANLIVVNYNFEISHDHEEFSGAIITYSISLMINNVHGYLVSVDNRKIRASKQAEKR
jgi:hypothetical protein